MLTGDTLFIGDVGRPDLFASIGFTRESWPTKLFTTRCIRSDGAARIPPRSTWLTAWFRLVAVSRRPGLWSVMRCAAQDELRAACGQGDVHGDGHRRSAQPPGYFVYNAILSRKERELLDEAEMPAR